MVAGVGVVEDEDVQPRVLARVVVAAGAPVLPLPHLDTRVTCHKLSRVTRCHVSRYLDAAPLLPHGLGVVEAPAALAVRLQREVAVLACDHGAHYLYLLPHWSQFLHFTAETAATCRARRCCV